MPKIIREGCIVTCRHCGSEVSFLPREVHVGERNVPAGYSPEEEAYIAPTYHIECPKCSRAIDVELALGHDARRELANSHARRLPSYDA